ncbi:MAG: hypothetical protein KatS3mg053_1709 [Candidatus Roseilinea sp.]|nr:MAG: hypothetical protein KatS3mg053_1709 [Candidatus Roseilinea sp.]
MAESVIQQKSFNLVRILTAIVKTTGQDKSTQN